MEPEWCLIATLLPYPYSAGGPHGDFRSQRIFPAGARLHLIGGFSGMGHDTVTAVGFGHHRRNPVAAHVRSRYLGGWQVRLVYRPALLRAIATAEEKYGEWTCHRWRRRYDSDAGRYLPDLDVHSEEYAEDLCKVAAMFQEQTRERWQA